MAKRKRLDPAIFVGEAETQDRPGTGRSPAIPPIAGVARDAADAGALAELSDALISARENGRMVVELPLAQIRQDHLVRDRVQVDESEMTVLIESLRARGQQTPVEVVALGGDRYGLISGWRRCQALGRLAAEAGAVATVLALVRRPQDASDAYLAMVEENEIRVGLSYYERARIALKSVEQGVFETERAALQTLFASASKAKRSKIGSFLVIVRALDGHLRFPTTLSERAGLVLARALETRPALVRRLQAALRAQAPATAEAERQCLESELSGRVGSARPGSPAGPAAGQRQGIATGLWLIDNPDGSVTLGGARVTAPFRMALRNWLDEDS